MKHRPGQKSSFQASSLIAVALLLLFVFVSLGYFSLVTDRTEDTAPGQAADLAAARVQWAAMRPQAFRYEVIRSASASDAPRSHFVVHKQGGVYAVLKTEAASGQADTAVPDEELVTVERLFADIAAPEEPWELKDVSYDPRFGYPATIEFQSPSGNRLQYLVRDFDVTVY